MSKKCTRCRAVYEKPAEKPQKNKMILLACPRCGCYSYTRVSGPTPAAPDAAVCRHENWTTVDDIFYCYDCSSVISAALVS